MGALLLTLGAFAPAVRAAPAGPSAAAAPTTRAPAARAPAAHAPEARAAGACANAYLRPTAANRAAVAAATVCLIDQLRAAHHLRPLRANRYLQAVASAQVGVMLRWNFFADIRPSGQTPHRLIASTGYATHASSLTTGQAIGWATGSDTTPASMVTAWMDSPPHRELILTGGFHDIGVGVTPALPSVLRHGPSGALYATELGARR